MAAKVAAELAKVRAFGPKGGHWVGPESRACRYMPACVRQCAHDCVHANAHGPMRLHLRLRAIGKWRRGSVYSTRPRHHLPLSQSVQPLLRAPLTAGTVPRA